MKRKITENGVNILNKIISDGFILEGNITSSKRDHWLTADESWLERPKDIPLNYPAHGLINTHIFSCEKGIYGIKEQNECKVATYRYLIKPKYLLKIEDLIKSGKKSFNVEL